MQTRKIGPFTVSAIGLGCMSLSQSYNAPVSTEDGARLVNAALDQGVTHFDTAALYGFGHSESLIGPVLKPHRDRIMLASKGGMAGVAGDDGVMRRVIDGRPEAIRRNVEDSLRRLGTDVIDLYYLHRWDKRIPVEESVGAMGEFVRKGYVRAIGMSEVSAETLRKAHKEFRISALQTEYSLWTRNPEIAVLKACRELGVAFVAFSPVARAFLTGTLPETPNFAATDFRATNPRFQGDNYASNIKLLAPFRRLAEEAGCTPAQFAIAWLLAKGDDILPIPGTKNLAHLTENNAAESVKLAPELIARADELINEKTVHGSRYAPQGNSEVDTEQF